MSFEGETTKTQFLYVLKFISSSDFQKLSNGYIQLGDVHQVCNQHINRVALA